MDLEKYSTNQLLLRSDRITFGTVKPSRIERMDILPDFTLTKLYFGLSSIVSTSQLSNINHIYPANAAFTFDFLNKAIGIGGVSSPQYAIDISSSTGIRLQGLGSFTGDAKGLLSVPTAALFSTLPSYIFGSNTIPVTSLQSSLGPLYGISVPTYSLFSTLPTYLFSPQTISLSSLQQRGSVIADAFVGDGSLLSNIYLSNVDSTRVGSFFREHFIPLNSLETTGSLILTDANAVLSAQNVSTSALTANSITSFEVSTQLFTAGIANISSLTVGNFYISSISTSYISTSNLNAYGTISAAILSGDGYNVLNLNPVNLATVIPSDKFGYRTIAFDALNPYGTFQVLAGSVNLAVPTNITDKLNVGK